MNRNRRRISPPRRQRGIATLLIVLAVGLAVSVTVAATVYSLRGTQSRQLTTHSATAAQAAAWRGVEALRLYLLQVDKTVWPGWVGSDAKPVGGMGAIGVRAATITDVVEHTAGHYRVNARVTGEAGVGSAVTTATLEVVYDVVPGNGTPGIPPVRASMPKAPMVFNGDLEYSGGKLDVTNATNYENIVVAGNLKVGGGSSARISGCVKGDVTLSGGGITDNGHIHSEGSIHINGMGNPSNTTLWGRNVEIGGGVSGGHYAAVKAGAYVTTVYSGGQAIGTAEVGGRLVGSTVTGGLPWTTGTVVPAASGRIVVTLNDGGKFLLDMSRVSIDPDTGAVSGAAIAELLEGAEDSALPEALEFRSTAVTGGAIGLSTLSISQLWGHGIGISGWSGRYDTLWANGNIDMVSGTIGNLLGGGDMKVNDVQVTGTGRLAGVLNKPLANVLAGQGGTTPGLPGLPHCDARVKPIDADNLRGMANYIFETVGGQPQLTIQHVKRADGSSIDGVYPLSNPSESQLAILQELMTCNNTNDKGCRNIRQADGSWVLHGVGKMPAGVLWFDAALRVDGTTVDLLNTLVNKGGDVHLSSAGHRDLVAPNFAGAAKVCGGSFYPSNLCASRSEFVTWKNPADLDANGEPRVYNGLPIANTGILTEEGARMEGWTIRGSVVLGKKLFTSGATVTIHGSLTVGSNEQADTTISAGGIAVDVPGGDGSLNLVPVCTAGSSATFLPPGASVLWSRYL